MAVTSAGRMIAFQSEIRLLHQLIRQQAEQLEKQQAVLAVQFERIAAIQAELDLVKATVRIAAPAVAGRLLGARPGARPGALTPVGAGRLPLLRFQRAGA